MSNLFFKLIIINIIFFLNVYGIDISSSGDFLNYKNKGYFDIQESVFKYNYMFLENKFKEEILKLNNDIKNKNSKEISQINDKIEINLKKYKLLLNNLIKESDSDSIKAEAYFRLSLINIKENPKEIKKSIYLIEKSLNLISENILDLNIRVDFFSASLYILNHDYNKAKFFYKKVIDKIDNNNLGNLYIEEKIRSLIGIGDCNFLDSEFNSSLIFYKKAEKYLDNSVNIFLDTKISIESLLIFRTILAAYRNGDYVLSIEKIKKYSYNRSIYNNYIDKKLIKNIIDIGGISIFELKNKNIFSDISKDKIYGDFGKEIILKSFPIFLNAGEKKFINEIAHNIKDDFYNSIYYYLFLKEWIDISKENENRDDFFYVCYTAIKEIYINSLWRERFLLDKKQDEERIKIILSYSIPTAEYYYKKGIQTKNKYYFLKSAEIYNIRLEENYIKDNRGLLLQKSAESLYRAEDYLNAYNSIERALKNNLDKELLKTVLFLRLNITRSLSADVKNTQEKNYKFYEDAVDEFLLKFPNEKYARNALFESAKRSETLGDFEGAKIRYERYLAYIPQNNDEFIIKEKNQNIQALAGVLLKIQDSKKDNVNAASNLEGYIYQFETSQEVQNIVKSTNATLAQNYYKKLNSEGKIREAAMFLSFWSRSNNKNPESSKFYIDSIKKFAELQDWKQALLLAENFKNIFPDDERFFENIFWQGKANENLLRFKQAAQNYENSADMNSRTPSLEEKITAINKSILFYKSLNMERNVAIAIERKAKLQSKIDIFYKDSLLSKIEAAEIYFKLHDNQKSSNIYKSLIYDKKIPKNIKIESQINFLIVNHNMQKDTTKKIDEELQNYININKKISKEFVEKTIKYLNNYDKEYFLNCINEFQNNLKISDFNKLIKIVNNLENRAIYLKIGLKFSNELYKTYSLLGKLNELIAENYSYAYYNLKKDDEFLKKSTKYDSNAKKFYISAIENSNSDDISKIEIYADAKKYFVMPKNIPAQYLFNYDIKNSAIFQSFYSNIHTNKTIALEKD